MTPNLILRKFSKISPDKGWSFNDVHRAETTAFSHGYHRYPAKFIPQIVSRVVTDNTKKGDIVCDPFGGCGTTLVESKLLGRQSIGFDINPVAKLITDTKIRALAPSLLKKYVDQFPKSLNGIPKNKKFKKHHPRIYYWFDKKSIKELDRIYAAINKIKNPEIRQFFLCAFSHNLKNSSRWLMKSIKPTIDKKKRIGYINGSFFRHLELMVKKNSLFYTYLKQQKNLSTQAKMYLKDSTKTLPLRDNSIHLIVTSPPYVTSYEYADLHQLSLLWFSDDTKNFKGWQKYAKEYSKFRKTFIGSSHKDNSSVILSSKIAQNIFNQLENKDKSLANSVQRYFADMEYAFGEMYRILKPEGKIAVIIGNTELQGVKILNAEVAAEQLYLKGFKYPKIVKRKIINKMISPWRDRKNGKFTNLKNPGKKRVYQYEYVLLMEK